MSEVDVSVVMTVYNGQKTVSKTIESILNQTLSNFEYIIINDGSTDETKELLEEFKKKDKRIQVINSKKVGRSIALNIAIKNSKSPFVANIDADDEAHPKRLERELIFLKNNPHVGLVSSDSLIIYDNEVPEWDDYHGEVFSAFKIGDKIKWINPISHPSIMVNFNTIDRKDYYYNEDMDKVVDYELWIRLYLEGYLLVLTREKLVAKRIHKNQSFENKNRKDYLQTIREIQLRKFAGSLSVGQLIMINLKYIYGLVPQKLRMTIRKFLPNF